MLALHAEVKALQQQHGLSYKDAAHRLYHSEVHKLQVNDEAYKAMSVLQQHAETTLSDDFYQKIAEVDNKAKSMNRTK